MKKINSTLLFIVILITGISLLSSCSDGDALFEDNALYTTEFSVYDCNNDYTNNPISTAFVSIGAEISIWEPDDSEETSRFKLVDVLTTGNDGKAIYNHKKPVFFYTVEKTMDDNEILSNLHSPLIEDNKILANQFQVVGVFTSEEDIEEYSKYNLPHLSDKFIPKIGNIKLKDTNKDNIIDLGDSVSKTLVYTGFRSKTEVAVYLSAK